jgi:phosphatidyl-myo-inositol dimannoside synthase
MVEGVLPTPKPTFEGDRDRGPDGPSFVVFATSVAGDGGIQRATRTLVEALTDLWGPERVQVLSVWAPDAGTDPAGSIEFWSATEPRRRTSRVPLRGRVAYLLAALGAAREWRHRGAVVIACHVELAPLAWAAARVSGGRYAVWCHGREAWGRLGPWVRLSLRQAAVAFAPSKFSARAVEHAAGMRQGSVRVVPHGLSREFVALDQDARDETVVTVARLDPSNGYKGIDVLVRAWPSVLAEAPQARLIVVGDGQARAALESLAESLGLSASVRFAGRLSDPELAGVMARARVFALPSLTSVGRNPAGEGFGLVFVEAGAAGLPVVAGRGGATEEVVLDGVSGLLVDPQDVPAVAGAISRLLTDPDLAAQLGSEGRFRARRDFSFVRFREGVNALTNDLVLGRVGNPAEGGDLPARPGSLRRTAETAAIPLALTVSLIALLVDLSPYDPFGRSLEWSPAALLLVSLSALLLRRSGDWRTTSQRPAAPPLAGWVGAVVGPAALTVALVNLPAAEKCEYVFFYLGLMVVLGVLSGLWPALTAAALSFILADYFLIPPVGSFTMAGQHTVVKLFAFVATAGVAGLLASQRPASRSRGALQR